MKTVKQDINISPSDSSIIDLGRGDRRTSRDSEASFDLAVDGPEDPPVDASFVDVGDPLCGSMDSKGTFSTCDPCDLLGNDCDTLTVDGVSRQACGCSAVPSCPCGLVCGCIEIMPNVNICSLCAVP